MSRMNTNIYSDIFDITSKNMEAAGMNFTVSKEAFLEMCRAHPVNADVYELSKEKDNKIFLEKAYITMLKRYADERAFASMEEKMNLPSEEFQRNLVLTIISSPEFANKNVDIYNNIYSSHNSYHTNLLKIRIYYSLKKIYDKFPEGVKKVLRRLLKKGQ